MNQNANDRGVPVPGPPLRRALHPVAAAMIGLAVLFGGGITTAGRAAETHPIDEPAGYRMDDYRSPTPATLSGARVVDTDAAYALWSEGKAAFIDVLPRPPKPANLPAGTVWRDKPRSDIPKSIWLPNVGYGGLAPETEAYFRKGLEQASGGDKSRTLVFYCLRDCWMSWNAAKRALTYGYTSVVWYPEGTDGWAEFNWPLAPVEPAP